MLAVDRGWAAPLSHYVIRLSTEGFCKRISWPVTHHHEHEEMIGREKQAREEYLHFVSGREIQGTCTE